MKKREPLGTPRGWAVCLVVTFAGIAVMLNQFKAPPVQSIFMSPQVFGIDIGTAGWLTSVFALAGLIFAVPASFILSGLGPKGTGLIATGATVIGVAIGAAIVPGLEPKTGFVVLIVSRIVEGTGVALMGVVGPSVISMYFNRERSGLPMGIWNIWYAGGSFTCYNVAVPLAEYFGGGDLAANTWYYLWWVGDIIALLAFLLVAFFVSKPKPGDVVGEASQPTSKPANAPKVSLGDGFKVKRAWVLAIAFCFLMLSSLSFLTQAPTFFREIFGMTPAEASTFTSLGYVTSIPASIICGLLLAHFRTIKQRNMMLLLCAIVELAIYPWCFLLPHTQPAYVVYLTLAGLATGFTAGCVWSAVPLTMPKRATIPVGMGLLQCFKSLANLVGTPAVGYVVPVIGMLPIKINMGGQIIDSTLPLHDWTPASYLIGSFAVVSLIFMIIYVRMKPEIFEEDAEELSKKVPEPTF
jgi:MFS family permease